MGCQIWPSKLFSLLGKARNRGGVIVVTTRSDNIHCACRGSSGNLNTPL